MKRLRLLILPAGIVAELLALGVAWLLALLNVQAAPRFTQRMMAFFPSLSWYWGK